MAETAPFAEGSEPLRTDVLLVDINGYALLTTEEQRSVVEELTRVAQQNLILLTLMTGKTVSDFVLGYIPTGDGFYILLKPSILGFGVFLALSLRNLWVPRYKPGLRIAVHTGQIAAVTDITGRPNFVGDALNVCARLLAARSEDTPNPGIPLDENYIITSIEADETFRKEYPLGPKLAQYLGAIEYQDSAGFHVLDKHGRKHHARFIECARYLGISFPSDLRNDEPDQE